jgi:hypothetical protein
MNIRERDSIIILVKLLRGNLTRSDFAEQAIHSDQLTAAYFAKNRG